MPFKRLLVMSLGSILLLVSGPAPAWDGSLRERLKERIAERQDERKARDTSQEAGDKTLTVSVSGHEREYLVHLPRKSPPGTRLPLVIALHGGGGDMNHMAQDQLYGLISKSDEAGFIVAFPNRGPWAEQSLRPGTRETAVAGRETRVSTTSPSSGR